MRELSVEALIHRMWSITMEYRKRILVVEDDVDIVNLLALHLSALGLKVESAASGRVGLKKALSEKCDLLTLLAHQPGQAFNLEAPDASPRIEPFSLSELVQDVVIQTQHRSADRGITMIAEQPDDLFLVTGNVGLVERLIANLLENALTHTEPGGRISVTLVRKSKPTCSPTDPTHTVSAIA
jgi:signal transduction histidine kinase